MKILLDLFLNFFKIGLFTIGGGYAMIPHIKELVIEKKKWLTDDEMMEIIAIAEATPGPIACNMATYIGYKQKKILGGITATIAVILPAFIIIYFISLFFDEFIKLEYVSYAFEGIKVAVSILLIKAALSLFKKLKKNILSYILFILSFSLMIIFELFSIDFSSIILILLGAVCGIIYYSLINKKNQEVSK